MSPIKTILITLAVLLTAKLTHAQKTTGLGPWAWYQTNGFANRICGIHLTSDSTAIDTTTSDLHELQPIIQILREGKHVCYPFFYSGANDRWPMKYRTKAELKMEVQLTLYLMQQEKIDQDLIMYNIVHSESGWMTMSFPQEMEPLIEGGEGCFILYFAPK